MKRVIVPLNMIANHILQNNPHYHMENASDINKNDNVNQSNIVIHQIEHPNIY